MRRREGVRRYCDNECDTTLPLMAPSITYRAKLSNRPLRRLPSAHSSVRKSRWAYSAFCDTPTTRFNSRRVTPVTMHLIYTLGKDSLDFFLIFSRCEITISLYKMPGNHSCASRLQRFLFVCILRACMWQCIHIYIYIYIYTHELFIPK